MTVHVFGSINLDKIYRVSHLVQPGETLSSLELNTVLGGKGANQSVALARAGTSVAHVGRIGRDDIAWLETLVDAGVDIERVEPVETVSGHAIIQVDDAGQNAIVLHGGANQGFERSSLEVLLGSLQKGDWLLMQNECDGLAEAIRIAQQRQVQVAFNPAPMDASVRSLPLAEMDLLVVNEIEAAMLLDLDAGTPATELAEALRNSFSSVMRVLTIGADGAYLFEAESNVRHHCRPPAVNVVDTTGAGDTFVGYLLAALVAGEPPELALQRAVTAGALAVTCAGATPSIPLAVAVEASMTDAFSGKGAKT